MRKLFILTSAVLALGVQGAHAEMAPAEKEKEMKVREFDQSKGFEGPEDYFTGNVKVEEPFSSGDHFNDYQGTMVNFEAGARTAWHTHPRGQTLYIVSGKGLVQSEGKDIQTVQKGDVVWFPANEKHWHGAAPDSAMSHIAIQSADENGEVVKWLEHVTDEQYNR